MTTLRVATFNMHHGRGMDGVVDLDRTAATISETGADVIALQELDRNVRRSGRIDQSARLRELTGMWVRFFPTTTFGGGEFGLAVAARDPLDLEFRLLPRTRLDRRHGVIVSRPQGIGMLMTHLSRRRISRAVETTSLCLACRRLGSPKMLLGDLNAPGLALGPMRFAGLREGTGFRPTFTSLDTRRQIDHVLVGRGVRIVASWTIPTAASDHLPLVADIAF
jgi:endonuclease/exonuclease/phosphatase family metal-dependent hydrolase